MSAYSIADADRLPRGWAHRLGQLLATVVLGLGGLLLWAQQAAATTCNIYWTGATSTNWTTASNWSLTDGGPSAGRLPTASEFACMSTAPVRDDIVLTSSRSIAGVDFATPSGATLTLSGANLTVGTTTNGSYSSAIRGLTTNGNTFGGIAAVTLSGINS
ncbi:MAG: hypothetical protein IPH03_10275 [Tetrasphaera sp.]|jgi:hypothetical protein|nr:hypothetical protein [Tetrasphaera sp.]